MDLLLLLLSGLLPGRVDRVEVDLRLDEVLERRVRDGMGADRPRQVLHRRALHALGALRSEQRVHSRTDRPALLKTRATAIPVAGPARGLIRRTGRLCRSVGGDHSLGFVVRGSTSLPGSLKVRSNTPSTSDPTARGPRGATSGSRMSPETPTGMLVNAPPIT